MMSQAAGISGRGRAELATLLGAGRRFVTPTDVVGALGVDPDAAAKKLSRWAEEGWVRRVRRGLYIGVPVDAANPSAWSEDALLVAAEVWRPCYFTGWTAAHHWALTEQIFRTTVLKTSERVRAATVKLLDHDYLVGHIEPDLLTWGLKTEWRDGVRLRFADPARTVVDILDRPRLGGGIRHGAEILEAYLDEHDPMHAGSGTGIDSGTEQSSSGLAISSTRSALTGPACDPPVRNECRRASRPSTLTGRLEAVES